MRVIRVLLIDEHEAPRLTLARSLANLSDIVVLGVTGDAEEGLRQLEVLHPDVVLVDPKMRKADGMDVCRRACASANGTRVMVLTSYVDSEERRQALRMGVGGYLLKEVDTPRLAQWLRSHVPEEGALTSG